jgi:peptidoglycan/LPS O-acetylase OafA/YrhL
MSANMHRPDIDGLRALAIVPVVLYHVGAPGCFGGFVGVDVFFVISGYLITGILVRELERGGISLRDFYRRRVLRIFPALFAMLAVCAVVAWATMLPGEFSAFARSTFATALFSSNLFFWRESGYFAPAAHSIPLLHTWSLAVEEQFYLFWPLILMALPRAARRWLPWLAVAIAAASFAAAAWQLSRDPAGAFYLIHARTWELMVGALLVWVPERVLASRALREAVALAGLAAILVAVKSYNQDTPFPGPAALLPVAGAAAILLAGRSGDSVVGRLLSLRPLVFLGAISFSLYLWHWPVIVFSQTVLYLEQTAAVRCAIVAVSVALAVVSWRFVETPFRRGGITSWPARLVLRRAALLMALFLASSSIAVAARGFPDRFDAPQQAIGAYESYAGDQAYRAGSCFVVHPEDVFDASTCLVREPGRRSLLIVGDSHAAHLWPGLHAAAGAGMSVLQATATGCRPVLTPVAAGEPSCRAFFRSLFVDWLPAHPVDVIVLAGRWQAPDLALLAPTIAQLQGYAARIVVVGPVPQYAASLPRLLVKALRSNDTASVAKGLVRAEFALDAQMRTLVSHSPAQYFSMIEDLCHDGSCRTYAAAGIPMQFDYGHFTVEGSRVAGADLMATLQ